MCEIILCVRSLPCLTRLVGIAARLTAAGFLKHGFHGVSVLSGLDIRRSYHVNSLRSSCFSRLYILECNGIRTILKGNAVLLLQDDGSHIVINICYVDCKFNRISNLIGLVFMCLCHYIIRRNFVVRYFQLSELETNLVVLRVVLRYLIVFFLRIHHLQCFRQTRLNPGLSFFTDRVTKGIIT